MKWTFWFFLLFLFLLINEYLAKFMLAVLVGDLGFSDAYTKTFQYASLDSYLMSARYRALPYIALAAFALKSNSTNSKVGRIVIWCIALFITAFHFYGYWGMQHSLFTEEHTSSTSGLAVIWFPIWALLFSGIAYTLIFAVQKAYRMFQKRV
ncbi:hypothetical protein [Alteromonas oceanisediminis]|uniref:hypothetical protein n=1 Tax=Alteromonas oceanisediminis TaxID=2836180 RepID=UPI001BDAD60C|nr:hypothetical protein [Alteromonas oceanisediminis]MBT0588195.1 hypothetical protein [Alteromonas oceanisediminis]